MAFKLSHIFRAYDIRGLVDQELTPEFALNLGKAFGTFMQTLTSPLPTPHSALPTPTIAVSRDNRLSGMSLKMSFIKGLISTGCTVIDLGELPSPMLYFAVCHLGLSAGVSITASHNPKEYNGFKFVGKNAHSIYGEQIQQVRKILESGNFQIGMGKIKSVDVKDDYHKFLTDVLTSSRRKFLKSGNSGKKRDVKIESATGNIKAVQAKIPLFKNFRVVIDCANSVAGQFYPPIFSSLGYKVIPLFCDSDGTFPNHEPDPIIESNLTALKSAVKKHKANFGLAFDGDGDRVSVVDELGRYHDANETLVILAKDLLSRHPKSTIVYTVSCSLIVPQEIEKLAGKSVMVPVGHSYVEEAMSKHKAILGGEQSGHFFIAENYYPFDDACFAALTLSRIFASSNVSVSELYSQLPEVYYEPEHRPFCSDDRKFQVVDRLTRKLKKEYPCITIDGVRADVGKGSWVGIRAGNTSPCISICIEAQSREALGKIKKKVNDLLKEEGIPEDK